MIFIKRCIWGLTMGLVTSLPSYIFKLNFTGTLSFPISPTSRVMLRTKLWDTIADVVPGTLTNF